jgi:hypothetical protein
VGAGVKPSKQTKTNKSKGKKRRRKTSQLQQQWTKEVYNNNISFLLPGAKHSRLQPGQKVVTKKHTKIIVVGGEVIMLCLLAWIKHSFISLKERKHTHRQNG